MPVRVKSGMYVHNLSNAEKRIFTTLLPLAAAIKHRQQDIKTPELLEKVMLYSYNEIDRFLKNNMQEQL